MRGSLSRGLCRSWGVWSAQRGGLTKQLVDPAPKIQHPFGLLVEMSRGSCSILPTAFALKLFPEKIQKTSRQSYEHFGLEANINTAWITTPFFYGILKRWRDVPKSPVVLATLTISYQVGATRSSSESMIRFEG